MSHASLVAYRGHAHGHRHTHSWTQTHTHGHRHRHTYTHNLEADGFYRKPGANPSRP